MMQETLKKSVKNGPKKKLPKGASVETGNPHEINMGKDTSETNN
jgi:hypothetical protein